MENLNYKFIVNNYEKTDIVEKLYTQIHNKGLMQHIKSMEDDMRKYNIKPVLITLLHDPHYILKGISWTRINEDRDKILEKLREDKTISYAISSIEIHPGKSSPLTKEERLELNENIINSKNITEELNIEKDNSPKTKTTLRKAIPKGMSKLIETGKTVLIELKNESMQLIHSGIVSELRYFSTAQTRKVWVKKIDKDKVRLIISLLESIGSDNELYKYMMKLYRKVLIQGKLSYEYTKMLDRYDFLKDGIMTLEGYPHIHIAIGLVSKDGEYTLCSDIYTKLAKMNLFDDIKVDEKKDNKKAYLNSINYVLKNDRFAGVKSIINGPIIKGYIGMDDTNIIEKMKGIGFKELKTGKLRKRVEMELLYISDRLEGMSSENTYNRLVSYIIYKMGKHGYVICEGAIYRKRLGSKMSYERYMDLGDFYTNITNNPRHQLISNKYRSGIIERMKARYMKLDGIDDEEEDGPTLVFPKIKMDKMNTWMECKDFFYNTLTGSIVKTNTKYYSYYYCSWLELKNLDDYLSGHRKNGTWTNILLNSKLDINKTCAELYRLLVLPQVPKGGVWYGYGDSNSGKSSLIKPFLNIYPPDQIGSIRGSIGRFDLYSVKDMAIIQGEEINPHTLNREDGLKLLGREPLAVEKKHGSSDRSIIRGRQIYTSNDLEEDLDEGFSDTLKSRYLAFTNRIVKMKFDSLKDALIDATTDINGETALTILMCGYYYYDMKYNSGNKGHIDETLKQYDDVSEIEGRIQSELDKYNGYYRVSGGKPKSAKKYKNCGGMMTPPRSASLRISPPTSPRKISSPKSISPRITPPLVPILSRMSFSPRSPHRSLSPQSPHRSLSPRFQRRTFSPRSQRRPIYPRRIPSLEDELD